MTNKHKLYKKATFWFDIVNYQSHLVTNVGHVEVHNG